MSKDNVSRNRMAVLEKKETMIELFEHNKTAYEVVCEQLADTGKACVIHPTGTGKSFIAFKWVEDNPDKKVPMAVSLREYIQYTT